MSHLHLPDGVLPAWMWVTGWVATLAIVWLASRAAEDAQTRRRVPLLAVVSALMLVAMSAEIVPIAYHVNLTVVGGVLLGPVLAPVAAFIAVMTLALLGHGGVTVVGLNALMVTAEMVLGWALFRGFMRLLGGRHTRGAALAATVLTLAITTSMLVGLVGLAGAQTGTLSVRRFAAVVFVLGPVGWALEALVTSLVLGYVQRVRPSLLQGAGRPERRPPPGDEGAH